MGNFTTKPIIPIKPTLKATSPPVTLPSTHIPGTIPGTGIITVAPESDRIDYHFKRVPGPMVRMPKARSIVIDDSLGHNYVLMVENEMSNTPPPLGTVSPARENEVVQEMEFINSLWFWLVVFLMMCVAILAIRSRR